MAHVFSDGAKAAAREMILGGASAAETAEKLRSRFSKDREHLTNAVVSQWARRGGWKFDPNGGAGLPSTESVGKGGVLARDGAQFGGQMDGAAMGGNEPGIDLDHYDPRDVRCSATERELICILLARNLRDLHRWRNGGWMLDPNSGHKLTVDQRIQRTGDLLRKFGGKMPKIISRPYSNRR